MNIYHSPTKLWKGSEYVSSDDYQVSLAENGYPRGSGWLCPDRVEYVQKRVPWDLGYPPPSTTDVAKTRMVGKRAVHILLESFLV